MPATTLPKVIICDRHHASTRPMQLSLDTSTTHSSYLFPGVCGGWLSMLDQGLRFHQGLRACEAAATKHR